jgi:hypothetical protein
VGDIVRRAVLAGAALLTAAPAGAGSLVSATLAIEFASLAPIVFVGSGVSGSSTGPTSVTLVAGSGFASAIHFPSPTWAAPPISGWNYTVASNGAGIFSGATPAVVGGEMPVALHICGEAYGGLCLINLNPPVGVDTTVMTPVVSGIGATMRGFAWTAGTATASAQTTSGTVPATRMGSNGLNGNGVGTLVLVSAVNVYSSIAGPLPLFATLSLSFVPEPAALPLLGAATLALALGVRRRAKRGA